MKELSTSTHEDAITPPLDDGLANSILAALDAHEAFVAAYYSRKLIVAPTLPQAEREELTAKLENLLRIARETETNNRIAGGEA